MPRQPLRRTPGVPLAPGAPAPVRRARPVQLVRRTGRPTHNDLQDVQHLQRTAGNTAVSAALQRLATAHPTLQLGSHGEAVKDAQRKLSRAQASAVPLVDDGQFGARTAAAVTSFRATNHLGVSTVIDEPTWSALESVDTITSQPTRAVLTPGTDHPDVGVAQQKINALGWSPRLVVDAVYGAPMAGPVLVLELLLLHRMPTGVVDAAFWSALDAAVAGGGTILEGANGTPVEQHVDSGTANSLGTQVAGTSLHPVVGAGGLTKGAAVKELQQKLNTAGASPPLVVDGAFGPLTTAAVTAFQTGRTPPLPGTGVADAATWSALDAVAPNSTVGAVRREWTEVVGGHTYGLTGAKASQYSWEVKPDRLLVTVKVNFTGLPVPGAWFGYVRDVWNRYKGVCDTPARELPIDFEMVRGSGGDAMTVQVAPGSDRANAGKWYAGDTRAASTVPHEFGHLVGLADEYQQHPGDYVTVTGHEPPVGQTTGPTSGASAAQVAQALQTALVAHNDSGARAAVAGMAPGAFAQRVVAAYAALPTVAVAAYAGSPGPPVLAPKAAFTTTGDLAQDLDRALPDTSDMYETIQVVTYSSGSIMGDEDRAFDPHDHGAQPRHVAQFVQILGGALGGTWRAEAR